MRRIYSLCFLCYLFSTGCTTPPKVQNTYSPQDLFAYACGPGKNVRTVQGHLRMKVTSKEVSGQFPADANVSAPDDLKLEITNLLGGTEALISIHGDHYKISRGGDKEEKREGHHSWGGIPLRWATDLFLGRIPCPDSRNQPKLSTNPEGDLTVDTQGIPQRFVFRFQEVQGKPWPQYLHWEQYGAFPATVDFKFEDPDQKSLSPRKWEAKSVQGKIRIQWISRESL